jgi:hypothetical protein
MRRFLEWYRRQSIERQKLYSLLGVIVLGTTLLYCAGLSGFALRNFLLKERVTPTITPILTPSGSPIPLGTRSPTPTLPPTPTQRPIPSPTPTVDISGATTVTPGPDTGSATPSASEPTPEPTSSP